jgi:hypothetical protein
MGDRRKCQTFAASPAEPGVSRLCQDFLLEEPKRSFAQIEPERFRDTEFLCSVVANSAGTERLRNSDIQPPQRSFELGGALPDRRRFDMTWLLAAITICVVNVVAGRAYSRYLDRLEAKAKADPVLIYLNVSPLTVEQLEAGFDCANITVVFTGEF